MSFRRLSLLLALPTVVGLSLSACGTEDDAAPGPSPGGSGPTAGSGGSDETSGTGGSGASGGATNPEGGMGGSDEPGPGGAGGDSAGGAGGDSAGGDGPGAGGEGGAPPAACHTILQAFDTNPGTSMGKYVTPEPPAVSPVQGSTVEWTNAEGVTASGAGKLNATFGAAGEQAQLSLYFTHAVWTCKTTMHAKVKLVAADLSHVKGVTLNINTGNWTRYASKFTSTATWVSDTWYSIELPFASADYLDPPNTQPDFNDVQAIGVMVQTKSDVTPIATTLFVDDVWLE